jgi:hemerythrin-like domain-containing protein
MGAILQALRQEHANLAQLLELIDRQLDGRETPDLDLLRGILDYFLTYPEQYHHPKEDLIYRALCRHDPALAPMIGDLVAEHEELGIATQEFSDAVDRACRDGAGSGTGTRRVGHAFIDFYREHMIKEEREFFNEAERCFTAEEWRDLVAEISDPTDPVFLGEIGLAPVVLPGRIRAFRAGFEKPTTV